MKIQLWLLIFGISATSEAVAQDVAPIRLKPGSLKLEAQWEPVRDTKYGFETKFDLIKELRPAEPRRLHEAESFSAILPTTPTNPGDVWKLEPDVFLPFLKQFHAGARTLLHHDGGTGIGAHGAWACLRAVDEQFLEISFRVHADFLLEGDGGIFNSSWFTPAQFAGRLIVDRANQTVAGFEMSVPDQSANVDINIRQDGGPIADIGRVPVMRLSGGTIPSFGETARQIPEKDSRRLLAEKFYAFARLDWMPLPEARAESVKSGKPIHLLILFGSLPDESC